MTAWKLSWKINIPGYLPSLTYIKSLPYLSLPRCSVTSFMLSDPERKQTKELQTKYIITSYGDENLLQVLWNSIPIYSYRVYSIPIFSYRVHKCKHASVWWPQIYANINMTYIRNANTNMFMSTHTQKKYKILYYYL